MCEFHDSLCNGFGDMWWTDKCTYFSSIDVCVWVLSEFNLIFYYGLHVCDGCVKIDFVVLACSSFAPS